MSTIVDDALAAAADAEPAPDALLGDAWQFDKNGKAYVRARGRKGILYQVGDESVAAALERDRNRDQRPRRKPKAGKKPPAPAPAADLGELEKLLADALRSPSAMCAMFGDEWAAEHFMLSGPVLARNLIVASEHNPWLRRRLEAAASGGDLMMATVTMFGVGGALIAYAIPPMIYWLNLPVPDKAREMFGIPERREHPVDAFTPPQPSEVPAAA